MVPAPSPRAVCVSAAVTRDVGCGIRGIDAHARTNVALTTGRGAVARCAELASRIAQRPSHAPVRARRRTRPRPAARGPSWPPSPPPARRRPLRRDKQPALYRRALETLPGGTDTNFRAWGESTIYVDRGKGGVVWDIDGNEFVDLRMGYGPVILGHGDERVDDYVNERMRRGVSFSLTSEDEVRAMELVKELTGWVDKARMTVSGTEATMHAMRIARAFTGREKIVKFEGQYHGVHDYALISVGPDDMSELGDADAPVAPGLGSRHPGRGRRHDHPGPLQPHRPPAHACSSSRARRSPRSSSSRSSATPRGSCPQPGFHKEMRALTEEFGILLIFDEVKTGFRFARGGAAEFFGITPDLATFAKAMGNGYPAAAFGGREEVMAMLPDHVSHGGTYAGNRVAAAAAVKTLEILRDTAGAGDHPRHRPPHPGRAARDPQPGRHPVPLHGPPERCSGSCSARRSRPSTATGRRPTTSCTTPSPSACTPAARCRSPTPASRGSCARRTPRATSSTAC